MNFLYYLQTTTKRIKHNFFTFLCSSIVMSLCIVLMSSCILTKLNAEDFMTQMLEQNDMVVYMESDLDEAAMKQVEQKLLSHAAVTGVQFKSKEEDYRNILTLMGGKTADPSLIDRISSTISIPELGASYQVILRDFSLMTEVADFAKTIPGVDEVLCDPDIAEGFSSVSLLLNLFMVSLAIVLGGVSLFLVFSFVRLGFHSFRQEIEIMGVVGATPCFIRTPFVLEGGLLGLLGGVIALPLQYGLHRAILYLFSISGVLRYISLIPFRRSIFVILPAFLLGGILLGMLCSSITLRWLMRPPKHRP